MKVVVIKSPKLLSGLFKVIFKIKQFIQLKKRTLFGKKITGEGTLNIRTFQDHEGCREFPDKRSN